MKFPLLTLSLLCVVSIASAQQPANPADARMREAMKKLMLQLRDAQTAQVAAQTAQVEAETKNKELTAKLAEADRKLIEQTKKSVAEKSEAQKTIAELNTKISERDKEAARLNEALAKWKEGFQKASDVATAKERERSQAADQVILLERKAAEHERKNREMYKLGLEILDRYAKFGFGTALLAREPFVGNMRVKFQNYLQDYGDKLSAQQIKPDANANAKPTASATSPKTKQ